MGDGQILDQFQGRLNDHQPLRCFTYVKSANAQWVGYTHWFWYMLIVGLTIFILTQLVLDSSRLSTATPKRRVFTGWCKWCFPRFSPWKPHVLQVSNSGFCIVLLYPKTTVSSFKHNVRRSHRWLDLSSLQQMLFGWILTRWGPLVTCLLIYKHHELV
jgi:hypothetical protein